MGIVYLYRKKYINIGWTLLRKCILSLCNTGIELRTQYTLGKYVPVLSHIPKEQTGAGGLSG